jgi:TonB family protein
MPTNNPNIPTYTAADLLRYATGQMTAPEMHAVEKAALEDPFLAEALEGYMQAAHSQLPLQPSIDKLSLPTAKKQENKVVPLWRRKAFQYAVAAVFILGGGWATYSLINSSNEKPQTNSLAVKKEETKAAATDTTFLNPDTFNNAPAQQSSNAIDTDRYRSAEADNATEQFALQQQLQRSTERNDETIVTDSVMMEKADNTRVMTDDIAKRETKDAPVPVTKNASPANEASSGYKLPERQQTETVSKARARNDAEVRNVFRGRITDAKNNPLPYANVMISGENIGTYTDSKGNFNITYDDSVLPIRTRSLGYESVNVQLKPGNKEQQIIMPEDEKLKQSLSVIVQKPQAKQVGQKPLIIETDSLSSALPVVGLIDYNTYLLNNNRISELPQASRSVELSFEVDKRGEVKNITVEQSSGKALDAEAIRLLKEGPKWKPNNGGTGRARVKVKL